MCRNTRYTPTGTKQKGVNIFEKLQEFNNKIRQGVVHLYPPPLFM